MHIHDVSPGLIGTPELSLPWFKIREGNRATSKSVCASTKPKSKKKEIGRLGAGLLVSKSYFPDKQYRPIRGNEVFRREILKSVSCSYAIVSRRCRIVPRKPTQIYMNWERTYLALSTAG